MIHAVRLLNSLDQVPSLFHHRPVTRSFDVLFSLAFAWINGWVNNREANDFRHHCAHCNVILMFAPIKGFQPLILQRDTAILLLIYATTLLHVSGHLHSYGHATNPSSCEPTKALHRNEPPLLEMIDIAIPPTGAQLNPIPNRYT